MQNIIEKIINYITLFSEGKKFYYETDLGFLIYMSSSIIVGCIILIILFIKRNKKRG